MYYVICQCYPRAIFVHDLIRQRKYKGVPGVLELTTRCNLAGHVDV